MTIGVMAMLIATTPTSAHNSEPWYWSVAAAQQQARALGRGQYEFIWSARCRGVGRREYSRRQPAVALFKHFLCVFKAGTLDRDYTFIGVLHVLRSLNDTRGDRGVIVSDTPPPSHP